jgi:PST family polysaccharide transporter
MWRELASYGRHVLVASGLQRASLEGRTAIVGHWLGSAPLGQYTLAFRLGAQPRALLVNGVSYVLMPALAHLSDDPDRFRRAALRGMQSVFLAAVPLNLLLVPFARPATILLFGSTWAAAGTAIAWMAGYGIIGAADSVASEVSKAARRPEWLPRMHAVRTVAVLGLTAAFLPWGVSGAAFALTAGEAVAAVLCVRAFVSVTGASRGEVFARLTTPALAGCALLAAAVPLRIAFDPSGYGEVVGLAVLAAEALAGAAAYLLVVSLLDPPAAKRALSLVRRALGRSGGRASDTALPGAPVAPS